MRFLNLFKSSNTHKRDNNNKENSDPRAGNQIVDENGQRRPRRVNFQQSGGRAGGGGRRRSCMTDLEEEDGASEVTLTATEAGRPQQQLAPPNPYSIITEPKRNRGPRSCPGGHAQYFGHSLETDESATILDRSLEAHSTFLPSNNHHHRRSSRRRIIGGTVIGVGGGQDGMGQQFEQQIPFTDIGNNGTGRKNHHWLAEGDEEEVTGGGRVASSSFGRYKNLPLVDQLGGGQARIREQQKELTELGFAYREERARRKALQRDLRREQQSRESLAMENFRLQSIIGLLLRQQQNSAPNGGMVGIDLNTLFGLCPSSSWATNTPSSSSAVGPLPPWATPNFAAHPNPTAPPFVGLFAGGIPSSTGQRECLAQPILSSSSLMMNGDARPHSLEQDEVKIFRNGGQHTDSFSGGSSRPTTGDKNEAELISEQSSRAQASFSSPEIGRSADSKENNCLSFSVDDCRQRESVIKSSMHLAEDIDRRPIREDDGYATSETNISASICTTLGDQQESGEFGVGNGKEMKTTKFPAIRSMSAETV